MKTANTASAKNTSNMPYSRWVDDCQIAVEKMKTKEAPMPDSSEAPRASLMVSSLCVDWWTKYPTRPHRSPAESTPHTIERRFSRSPMDPPPKTFTSPPHIGWSGTFSASIPIHCVARLVDEPGNMYPASVSE